jgi:bifunctional DNA-binding transcriptional regulator/antitoxin component of YhaV-PrlF toxin-antitoxin module
MEPYSGRAVVEEDGRILVPRELRAKAEFEAGTALIAVVIGDAIVLLSRAPSVADGEVLWSEELIAERRFAALQESPEVFFGRAASA